MHLPVLPELTHHACADVCMQADAELHPLTPAQILPTGLQKALLEARPHDASELAAVEGMPALTAERYGAYIMAVVRASLLSPWIFFVSSNSARCPGCARGHHATMAYAAASYVDFDHLIYRLTAAPAGRPLG